MEILVDTHKLHTKLVQAGFDDKKAEAVVDSILEANRSLVTHEQLRSELRAQTIQLTIVGLTIAGVAVAFLEFLK